MAGSNIATTLTAFAGGSAAVATQSSQWVDTFTGTWAAGDTISTVLTNALTGSQATIGYGAVTGKKPTFVFVYKDKVYSLIGDTAYMTAIAEPTVWNDPNATGNGSVQMSNFSGSPMQLLSVANYQGRLVFLSRDTILIWQVDPDPANWSLVQSLQNIGTVAKDSVKALGDLDVFFLADSGVRSVRVRDSSLNAFVSDIGSPIDLTLTSVMQGTSPNTSSACAVVEPSANRYWLFLKDTIYVLSYFPSNKILAWSTYKPTFSTGNFASQNVVITETGHTIVITSDTNAGAGGSWILEYSDNAIDFSEDTDFSHQGDTGALPFNAWNITASPAKRYWRVRHDNGTGTTIGYSNIWDSTSLVSLSNVANQVAFTPYRMCIFGGQVYMRGSDGAIYQYGGSDNNTYDASVATIQTPFHDIKAPMTRKGDVGAHAALSASDTATWSIGVAFSEITDPSSPQYQTAIANVTASTFDGGKNGVPGWGTHISFQAQTSGSGSAVLSELCLTYQGGDTR